MAESTKTWFKVGAHVMTFGVNDDYVGEIVEILPSKTLMLKNASWVSESGRLHTFIARGSAEGMQIEPVGDICVSWLEVANWPHKLFKEAV